MKNRTYKVSYIGLMLAVAFVLSYIETLIPVSVGIPGVKAGLSNIPIMVTLYTLGSMYAAILACVKVILVSVTFGSMSSFFYSFAGALTSILMMTVMKRIDVFSTRGVSIIGGITHNLAQIAVAVIIVENMKLLYYTPVLVMSGVVAGLGIGLIADLIIKRIGVLFVNNDQK